MNSSIPTLSSLITLFVVNMAIAQFTGFEDAPTRRGISSVRSGTLEGLYIERTAGETPDAKEVSITFILSKLPSAFFDYYDPEEKAIILDLYDTRVGESELDSLKEFPITSSRIEDTQIDLNKDIAGLKPDFRDVVRVFLYSPYDFRYRIEEEFGILNLTFPWNKEIEKQLKRSKSAIYWRVPLAMGIVGSMGLGAYLIWFKDNNEEIIPPIDIMGDPPSHP